jgi:hypothetical protein
LQIGRGAGPDHGLAQELDAGVAHHLELVALRGDLHVVLVLGVLLGIDDPAAVPLAAGNRLDVADDLEAAAFLVIVVLDPDDAAAKLAVAVGDLDAPRPV